MPGAEIQKQQLIKKNLTTDSLINPIHSIYLTKKPTSAFSQSDRWQDTIDPPHLDTISVEPAVEAGGTLEDREGQDWLQVLQTHGAGLWQACVT